MTVVVTEQNPPFFIGLLQAKNLDAGPNLLIFRISCTRMSSERARNREFGYENGLSAERKLCTEEWEVLETDLMVIKSGNLQSGKRFVAENFRATSAPCQSTFCCY